MGNMMDTTQLGFYLKIQIFPFGAPMVGLDFHTMEPIMQFDLQNVIPFWQSTLGLEPLQLLSIFVPPPEVIVFLVWREMP
jgi:hypothetical protein